MQVEKGGGVKNSYLYCINKGGQENFFFLEIYFWIPRYLLTVNQEYTYSFLLCFSFFPSKSVVVPNIVLVIFMLTEVCQDLLRLQDHPLKAMAKKLSGIYSHSLTFRSTSQSSKIRKKCNFGKWHYWLPHRL